MKPDHLESLRALIAQNPSARTIDFYHSQNLTDKRRRWDALWAIPNGPRQAWFDDNGIYDYLDDRHIDTALKALCNEI